MKLFPLVALILFPFALSHASARGASAQSTGPVQPVTELTVVDIELAIDRRTDDVAKDPNPSRVADALADVELLIKGLGIALEPFPGECRIQARLESEIAELRSRAARYAVRADDLAVLQREIVLNRLERAVIAMRQSLFEQKSTRAEVAKAVDALSTQAFDFLDTLDTPDARARLSNAVRALTADAHAQMDPYEQVRAFYVELMEIRIEMALRTLQQHANGRISQRDFQRVIEAYQAQSALVHAAIAIPYDCET